MRVPKLHPWLAENICCPRDRGPLTLNGRTLACASGHAFPIVDGVPVMLLDDKPNTEPIFEETLKLAAQDNPPFMDPYTTPLAPGEIDGIAQRLVAGSCGRMYIPLINKLKRYPIPHLRLKPSNGGRILDIGCAWGRWSLAAASLGYRSVGIDPSIYNVFAARRIAKQLGYPENIYLVADGRYLPFVDGCFEVVFSYSCLQHMDEEDVRVVLHESRRTLNPAGVSLIEMPNKWGLWNLFVRMKRGFRTPTYTSVHYWSPTHLVTTFNECIGPTKLAVDGFFTIDPQISDLDMLPLRYKFVVLISEGLRRISDFIPGLKYLADSLYVVSSRKDVRRALYPRKPT
jgi:SAM-dependent methyltransferase/uncharacterized protein YbaR (Trm112 family)